MKVLIVSDFNSFNNPFVQTLAEGIKKNDVDITCSLDDFWCNYERYDIIHIQWPNLLVRGLKSIEPLKKNLQNIKALGKQIVLTCHNLHPHYCNDKIKNEAYDVVYNNADVFVHMGKYSYIVLQKQYPNAKHVIIPHHVYDQLYKFIPSRDEAIKKLHLNPKFKYILCFGAFRDDEERNMVSNLSRSFSGKDVKFFAPGFYKIKHKNLVVMMFERLKFLYGTIKNKNIIMDGRLHIPDYELPYYYSVSDIAFIQRVDVLNSGNLPMALLMGKVVVGPNVGNVGTILQEIHNPVFEVSNSKSIIEATALGLKLAQEGLGETNRQYAFEHLSSSMVGKMYADLYSSII